MEASQPEASQPEAPQPEVVVLQPEGSQPEVVASQPEVVASQPEVVAAPLAAVQSLAERGSEFAAAATAEDQLIYCLHTRTYVHARRKS